MFFDDVSFKIRFNTEIQAQFIYEWFVKENGTHFISLQLHKFLIIMVIILLTLMHFQGMSNF